MTPLQSIDFISTVDVIGYLAATLVFFTFYTKTMIPLRYIAIGSNIVFIIYAWLAQLNPILILHSALLPLNLIRLWQFKKLIAEVGQVSDGDFSMEWLFPYMTKFHKKAGEYLFYEGDKADQMFYVVQGTVSLPEVGVERSVGQMLGEIGLFSPTAQRITSVQCKTDCDFLTISADKVIDLYYQNPKFGIYLLRLITGRLVHEVDRLKKKS